MIITAHQPNYLPWIGLFHKICLADRYVIYDDVAFTHYGFANRTNILGKDGIKTLIVPVHRFSDRSPRILDVCIDKSNGQWRRKHWMSIVHCYGKAPYFGTYADAFEAVYLCSWERLVDLNIHLFELVLEFLGIRKPVLRASSLGLSGRKSDRVIDLCLKLGAEAFIFGAGGRKYADLDAFQRAGIKPLFHHYRHPRYPQGAGQHADYISVIDLLFNCGPASLDVLNTGQDSLTDLRRGHALPTCRMGAGET